MQIEQQAALEARAEVRAVDTAARRALASGAVPALGLQPAALGGLRTFAWLVDLYCRAVLIMCPCDALRVCVIEGEKYAARMV